MLPYRISTTAKSSDTVPRRSRLMQLVRSPYVLLFLTLLVVYVYTPPRWQDWNQNSRIDLTMSIVNHRTVWIDHYVNNTGDYATIGSHTYSDKAPGLSLLAVPTYAATKIIEPLGIGRLVDRASSGGAVASTLNPNGQGLSNDRLDIALALYLATLICVSIPGAISAVLVALIVERLTGCRTSGIGAGLLLGLATPMFTYSQAFYGHVPAAACLIGAFAILTLVETDQLGRWALFSLGFLLALAVVIEYPAAVVGLPIAMWAVTRARTRAVVFGLLGSIIPFSLLAVYDLAAFRTLLPVGYEHSTLWQDEHKQGFLSITHPTWNAIWGLSFSPYRGLFFFSPVLLVAIAGLLIGFRNRRLVLPTAVAIFGFAAIFLVIASSVMWWGGFAAGPRYLIPGIPLLGIPLGYAIAWANEQAFARRVASMGVLAALGAISALMTWSVTLAGQNYPPDEYHDPIRAYVLPALRAGNVARNLGNVIQLSGVASVIPLVVIVVVGVGLLMLLLRQIPPSPNSPTTAGSDRSHVSGLEIVS